MEGGRGGGVLPDPGSKILTRAHVCLRYKGRVECVPEALEMRLRALGGVGGVYTHTILTCFCCSRKLVVRCLDKYGSVFMSL